jgi:hypothetical protein
MAAHWPTSTKPVAPVMNDIPKVMSSKTLQAADWPESRIASADTAKEIARLKAEPTARSSPTAASGSSSSWPG